MPSINIDKERFLNLIEQFRHDIPFQQMMFNKLKSIMPEEYFKQMIADMFHQYVFADEYYIAEHHIFKDQKHYFKTFDELHQFLSDHRVQKEYYLRTNKVHLAMDTDVPISGYIIRHIKK
jgi:hypothetical protein